MKKSIIIALAVGMIVGCQKKNETPANSKSAGSSQSAFVWCIKSYTTYLECNTTSEQSALDKGQWYRDHNYTMVTVTAKGSCAECY